MEWCQVAEACCLPEGICGLLIPDECIRRGGLPQGRASCDGIECLITACCFPDGSCENIPPNFCVVEGGDPGPLGTVCLGDNNNNKRDDFCDCAGDVNGDGAVDAADKGFIEARYGCSVIDPNCAQADANRDGAIDAADTGFVEARYGSCQPITPPPDR